MLTVRLESLAQSQQQTAAITHVSRVTPVILTAATIDDIVLYLDTGASSNAVSSNFPIIHDVPTSQHLKSSDWDRKTVLKLAFYSISDQP